MQQECHSEKAIVSRSGAAAAPELDHALVYPSSLHSTTAPLSSASKAAMGAANPSKPC